MKKVINWSELSELKKKQLLTNNVKIRCFCNEFYLQYSDGSIEYHHSIEDEVLTNYDKAVNLIKSRFNQL